MPDCKKGNGHVALDSHNPLLDMRSRIDALLSRHNTDLTFSMDMRSIALHALRLTDKTVQGGYVPAHGRQYELKKTPIRYTEPYRTYPS